MGPRPVHLGLDRDGNDHVPPRTDWHLDLPSPRIGEVPPALSPLDAFAMQSRLLAKQFEQEQQNGRRISRLPPVMVQQGLLSRPDYFRKISGGSETTMDSPSEVRQDTSLTSPKGLAVTGGMDNERPISHYPRLGHASRPSRTDLQPSPHYDAEERPVRDYFGVSAPRASSPEPVDPRLNVEAPSPLLPSLTSSMDSVQSSQPRTFTDGSTHSQRSLRSERGLYPPKSPGNPRSPRSLQSIRSVPPDSGDEEGNANSGAYATSSSRNFSSSSNLSRPQSPFRSYPPPQRRSPSMASEFSSTGAFVPSQKLPGQRAFNFSRPLSSSGQSAHSVDTRPSFESRHSPRNSAEMRHRRPSVASNSTHQSRYSADAYRPGSHDDVPTPYTTEHIESPVAGQVASGDYFQGGDANGVPSYIYAKYALPRGRAVDRNSIGLAESWGLHQFSWDESQMRTAEASSAPHGLVSNTAFPPTSKRLSSPAGSEKISGTRLSRRDLSISSIATRSRSANPGAQNDTTAFHRASPSAQTESTDRTITATPLHERSASTILSPEQHLEVGIQAYSAGEVSKSTYHLRLAAYSGLPTGMLLYALACRYGWGVQADQEEGVKWLREAIDTAGLEVVEVEATLSKASHAANPDPVADAAERRNRKAQFALAIYELGITYMNGWGCPKDKPLAVRCYEVAGSWGDADALAEAGFCYTQGVGCRKDLKKGAMLYRKAAVLGMSMAGNSWIYKAKYLDDNPISRTPEMDLRQIASPEMVDPKPRSRTRSIWSRKKDKA
ncbi:hypothetical protein B0A54_09493 [Friedmanniomyces endolithicus]|uniref:HCP-like protein n=1 Tax=Friedmanniomyces endolithicus TaxID=329885 RepID=A0A4U0URF6_9PEZI|nr:hypothetical protein LTS09_005341 [Friedmanniomyces endolithicus]TKA38558.1 hypothetical protein B0A54_09493 [Friedmanniomyces endolithicus]